MLPSSAVPTSGVPATGTPAPAVGTPATGTPAVGTPAVGTDLVTVADVQASIDRFGDRYLGRIYTPLELIQTERSTERIAARFAGKEAVVKLLRLPAGAPLPYRDVEIASTPSGAPRVRLHGRARDHARSRGLGPIAISLTHDNGLAFATAMTVLPRKEPVPVKDAIRTVLDLHGRLNTPAALLADTDDLYQAGLTSHATVNVMLALEEELDLEFPDELMVRGTFASVGALEAAARSLAPGE